MIRKRLIILIQNTLELGVVMKKGLLLVNLTRTSTHRKIDAMTNRDYDDIESISTDTENMIRSADNIQSEISAKQWQQSESMDSDLIEAVLRI